jgi:hypothetical protein
MNKLNFNEVPVLPSPYYTEDNKVLRDDGKDNYTLVMHGVSYVDGCVFDPYLKTVSCVIVITPLVGPDCVIRVDMAKLSTPKAVAHFLAERGIIVPKPDLAAAYLRDSAVKARMTADTPQRILIKQPGWYSGHQLFYTGVKVIAAAGVDSREFWFEPVPNAPLRAKGTLTKWQTEVSTLIVENPIVLAITCIALGSLLLDRFNFSSSIYNICGLKGKGKTSGLQLAASAFGNGIDPAHGANASDPPLIARYHGTMNGYEPLLKKYSPGPTMFDEMTEANVATVAEASYMMSSGEGKQRMNSNGAAADQHRWLTSVIVSSEVSITAMMAASKKPVHGGQADRAIDIPIDEDGIIIFFGPWKTFDKATGHIKRICSEQYGTAAEAFLQYCVDYPDEVAAAVQLATRIENQLVPVGCGPGERRVVKRLAAAAAAGHLAVAAGIFDEDVRQRIDASFGRVATLWWETRAPSLACIRKAIEANIEHVVIGDPQVDSAAYAFVGKVLTIIPVSVFNNEFGAEAKSVLGELKSLGALETEQTGRWVHRFCNNQVRGYAIFTERLWLKDSAVP